MSTQRPEPDYPRASVIHKRDMEPGDVYIGRPSKWGNPFVVGVDGPRGTLVERYREYIQTQPELLAALPELIGKRLVCYCKPNACHGDVLSELANEVALKQHQAAELELAAASPEGAITMNVNVTGTEGEIQPLPPNPRVLVCGSRDWPAERVDEVRARINQLPEGATVIAGGARGVDKLAEDFARERGLVVEVFPADWDGLGESAGFQRNLQMLDAGPDLVVAFQSNASSGTGHTIEHALKRGINLELYDELNFVDLEAPQMAASVQSAAPEEMAVDAEAQVSEEAAIAETLNRITKPAAEAVTPADPETASPVRAAEPNPPVDVEQAAYQRAYVDALQTIHNRINVDARQREVAIDEYLDLDIAGFEDFEGGSYTIAEQIDIDRTFARSYDAMADRIANGLETLESELLPAEQLPELSAARRAEAWTRAMVDTHNVAARWAQDPDHSQFGRDAFRNLADDLYRSTLVFTVDSALIDIYDQVTHDSLVARGELPDIDQMFNALEAATGIDIPGAPEDYELLEELRGASLGRHFLESFEESYVVPEGVTLPRPEAAVRALGAAPTLPLADGQIRSISQPPFPERGGQVPPEMAQARDAAAKIHLQAFQVEYDSALSTLSTRFVLEAADFNHALQDTQLELDQARASLDPLDLQVLQSTVAEYRDGRDALNGFVDRIAAGRGQTGFAGIDINLSESLTPARRAEAWTRALADTHTALVDSMVKLDAAGYREPFTDADGDLITPDNGIAALRAVEIDLRSALEAIATPLADREVARRIHDAQISAFEDGRMLLNDAQIAVDAELPVEVVAQARPVVSGVLALDELNLHSRYGPGVSEILARPEDVRLEISGPDAFPKILVGAQRPSELASRLTPREMVTTKQLGFLTRLYASTGEAPQVVATKAAARTEIDRLSALRENTLTDKQKDLLKRRSEMKGVEYVEPQTQSEFREQLNAIAPTTIGQMSRLQRMAALQGRSFTVPENSLDAARQIDELQAASVPAIEETPITTADFDRVIADLELEEIHHADNEIEPGVSGRYYDQKGNYLTPDDIERIAKTREFERISRQIGRDELGAAMEDPVGSVLPATMIQEDEVVQENSYAYNAAEERYLSLSPEERQQYNEEVAFGERTDFTGVDGSAAQWSYGGETAGSVPGRPAADWQIEKLEQLAAETGRKFVEPETYREAQQEIAKLEGPPAAASAEQKKFLQNLVARRGKYGLPMHQVPEVTTKAEAQHQISKFLRDEYRARPNLAPTDGQLGYLSKLQEAVSELNLHMAAPTSAIEAERRIDTLKQVSREAPEAQAITRELLISEPERFDELVAPLSEAQQAVLRLRYREGFSVEETAKELRVDDRVVTNAEFVGRDKFRRQLAVEAKGQRVSAQDAVKVSPPQMGI